MIKTWPDSYTVAPAIRRLADQSFDVATVRNACAEIGAFDDAMSDRWLWSFRRSDGPRLIVGVDDEGATTVGAALLSTCLWETYDRRDHDDADLHAAEQIAFDKAYEAALRAAEAATGRPHMFGRDQGKYPHRWALWRGRRGLFVVQQSAHDLQFGVDVTCWVRPWTGGDPEPTEPFIDWIVSEGVERQARHQPPLLGQPD